MAVLPLGGAPQSFHLAVKLLHTRHSPLWTHNIEQRTAEKTKQTSSTKLSNTFVLDTLKNKGSQTVLSFSTPL